MFGGGTLAVVTNAGALAVRTEDRDALLAVIPLVADGNALVIVEQSPSGAKYPGQTKLAEAIKGAGGAVRGIESPKEGALAAWIDGEAHDRGIRLGVGAREGARDAGRRVRPRGRRRAPRPDPARLDGARQARPLPAGRGRLAATTSRALVAEAVPGSAWALADAVAERDDREGARSSSTRLAESMAEPVLVVVLHRRIRELLELQDRIAAARRASPRRRWRWGSRASSGLGGSPIRHGSGGRPSWSPRSTACSSSTRS